jgi:L-2-hydroxyglutarate oxidase LhgO
MDTVDCVIVGAGVIGLAIARALALAGREILLLERNERFGAEISSRNSEVIHAGIYYRAGSLKAQLCVRGRELLYEYCRQRQIAHRRCGKLIVATEDAQLPALQRLRESAQANGVDDLALLDRSKASELEPALRCVAALHSPSTGIIDAHGYMLALLGEAEEHGARLVTHTRVEAAQPTAQGIELRCAGESKAVLRTRWLINAAGLGAVDLASRIAGFPVSQLPPLSYAKGSYFALQGPAPFSRLIYPLPDIHGLGIHLTLDLAGQARFGPDVEWVDAVDYRVDAGRAAHFSTQIRSYWPQLRPEQLVPAYSGVRPKLSAAGEPPADFRIDGPQAHGIDGVINLLGIESPGLTASLAIAERVAALVCK